LAFKSKIFILVFILFIGCMQPESSRVDFALGTVCSITLFDQGLDSIYNEIFARIHEIESLMSVNIPSSDISRINKAAGIEPVQVHKDTFMVIERAVYFAELSGGAFDPTVGPLVSLWGINRDEPRVPSQDEIDAVLPLINWRNIKLDSQTSSVYLTQKGMALDLGSIAKGYAADEAAAIIRKAGIERAIVDLGGNIIMIGERKDKNPWRVGIQNPIEKRGAVIGVLQITEKTVVTSGIYERYFDKDGIRYHHIFDPSNGYPAKNGLLSATVVTDISMDADALSTILFVLGYEKRMVLFNYLPNTETIFVFQDNSIRTTDGVNFTVTDSTFFIKN